MSKKNIKSFIDELIKEIEDELDEANVTGNVDGYDTPNAFSGKNSDKKRKKTATQFGYTLVNNDINNIDESVNESLKHLIHVETPKEIVSKSVAAQIMALAKKGVRSHEIGLNMGFVGNQKMATDAFQKVKNKIYFSLDKRNESINELTQTEKRIKDGKSGYTYYVYYKGQFAVDYDMFGMSTLDRYYRQKFKVRNVKGSSFNPDFIIINKIDYDRNPNHYSKLKPYVDKFWDKLQNESINEALDPKAEKFLDAIQVNDRSIKDLKNITVDATPQGNWSVYYKGKRMFTLNGKMLDDKTIMKYGLEHMDESLSEGKKIQRPVNRWLELKNDESMHANKKLATGLRELKYQLKEVETFFRWYNQIKTMNELSSDTFWKRTHGHIYKIKERLINIAKTIQEIEK